MDRYTVIWWPPALDDLAGLWMASSDRDSITNAADAIDRALAESPSTKGVAVREGLRRFSVPPLEVQFSVEDDDRRATVWTVRMR